jgi:hypothetical protein
MAKSINEWDDTTKEGCVISAVVGGCLLPCVAIGLGFAAILLAFAWSLL